MSDQLSKVVPPEAVPVKDDAMNFGVVQPKDWVIPTSCGVRVVDERMAYGWNECRKSTIARIESAAAPVEVDDVERVAAALAHESEAGWAGDLPDLFRNGADTIRTLARQLAECEEDRATARRAAIANEQEAERMGVLLAAATRRVAEVEGLVGKWREAADGERDYYSDGLRACAMQLESALKEPK